jgi:hypothetical protein
VARRISACFALSGQARPALTRIKVPPPIIASETIRSRACQQASPMPGPRGVRWEYSVTRARCASP